MDVREKLVEIMEDLGCNDEYCKDCEFCNDIDGCVHRQKEIIADRLIANGVTVQERGNWKYYHKQNKAVCTSCSFERDLDANFGKAIACPNCGAYMPQPPKGE